jgi:3-methyl-2-oxobutanoate hydroxymethyltransferase
MKTITINTLNELKRGGEKFPVVTAYDSTFARLAEQAGIEVLLVGDSLGNVMLGYSSTVPVSMADMVHHTAAVCRGSTKAFVIADLPFMAYATAEQAMTNAAALMQAGAQMVKLEGGAWLAETVAMLTERGVPVCGHLGLTPQSVNKFGGYRVQGRGPGEAERMLEDARLLQAAGAGLLVLECVPRELGTRISGELTIPVVGIGAGAGTDAQVLVVQDLLGISARIPKFARDFLADSGDILGALRAYSAAVRDGSFPGPEHSFT